MQTQADCYNSAKILGFFLMIAPAPSTPTLTSSTDGDLSMQADGEILALRYDPEAIAQYYLNRPFQVWQRWMDISTTLLRFRTALWWDKQTGQADRNQPLRAAQLRELLTELGPAFIKVGQALSTRPDLVPPFYLEELTRLQDQLPAFSNDIAFGFIEEELGAPPREIFAELSAQPVSAASLGQVYKGMLNSGETVAVKVQRPGLAERISLDLYIMRGLAAWAMRNIKRVRSNLVAIADEFGQRIFEEMDYTQEGHNAERFRQLYGHLKEIYVPKIYWNYTHRRVLTMEWIDGTKLTNLPAIQQQGIDASHLIEIGVQCSLRQLLQEGFFHADPHPGNLLAMANGKLAYLDFGMMSEVQDYQRYGLIEAVVHLVNRDFEALAKDYVKLEFLSPETDLRPIVPALAKVFQGAVGASVSELNFKALTDQLSEVMYEFPFKVPPYYALIIRSLVTMEGIAINVDPDFKVLSKAYPYIAKRLLVDPSPDLRQSLRELLFKDGSFRWNRLENLLNNARNSDDYDIDTLIDKTSEYLFSERGNFLREQLVSELVNGLDQFGWNTLQQIRQRLGLAGTSSPQAPSPSNQSLDHVRRIVGILQATPSFDPLRLAPKVPALLGNRGVQQMGQQVAVGLAQKSLVRFIRDVVLAEPKRAA
jgi:predicted unusual protein kinase regulating ubiquinone biosynthesis (AarF/ABC1/UbiB family)